MSTCGEQLMQLLQAYGVDTVFGIPGVHTVELYRGLPATAIRHITPRHEQGAGFMADGYARVTGKPGVCLIITGPGMTNIATAMGQALADSIPLLVISSVNRRDQLALGEGRLHELPDQRAMLAGVTRFSHTLMDPANLPQVMAQAFTVFGSERPGPVHIEIPLDVITAHADEISLQPYPLPGPPAPDPSAIDSAASLLAAASSPLLIVGGGALQAASEVIALAETLDVPVLTTVNAKGLIPASHPLATGGSPSCRPLRAAMEAADLVLAVGTEFAETDYDFFFAGALSMQGKLIRVDIDPRQLNRNVRATLPILGDARLSLAALLEQLPPANAPRVRESGVARAAALREQLRTERDPGYTAFLQALVEALPEVTIVGDSTQPTYFAWLYHDSEAPRRYFHSASGYGTLGYAIPAAIGAAVANPGQPVIGLIGDGAAQFTLGELASAVELGLPLIFLLWNNSGYGEIKRFMQEGGIHETGVDIHTPDFVAVARAMGCHADRARDLPGLQDQLREAMQRTGPTLLEVVQEDFVSGYPMP